MNCEIILILFIEFSIFISAHELSTTSLNKIHSQLIYNATVKKSNVKLPNSTQTRKVTPSTLPLYKINNKWQIGRVTNKQYEIINLLWQKTKIFLDVDHSNATCRATTIKIAPTIKEHVTSNPRKIKSAAKSPIWSKVQPSTPSFIEFYYLDETVEKLEHKQPPYFPISKLKNDSRLNSNNFKSKKSLSYYHHVPGSLEVKLHEKNNINDEVKKNKSKSTTFVDNSQLKVDLEPTFTPDVLTQHGSKTDTSNESLSLNLYPEYAIVETSTVYDKIKFFETYDSNTPKWDKYVQNNVSTYYNHDDQEINRDDNKIILERVNFNTGHQHKKNKTRFVKKHIDSVNSTESTETFNKRSNGSRLAVWPKFSFVAAYIYEPSEVRCDAASISPHWLLAGASCLSRHRKELREQLQSAYVIFCSENWRRPNRISYVKRTLIHPQYHPKEIVRRYRFNVGVIQVVNSMADTCNGWAPVSLLSHQFTADQEGSVGIAVGWGLDRYDKIYTTTEIPTHTLMKYETLVYSQSCPGSFEYSKVKKSDEGGIKSVYCILLPPYIAEENDTIHGALLLVGGKLLALYLQEERRSRGVQSAQYIGLWRLLPWVADAAREPVEQYSLL